MTPDDFRNVLAPGLLAHHQQSFHLAGLHYHFTPTGGAVVLGVLVFLVAFAVGRWLLARG
jgi:hypothetical protein